MKIRILLIISVVMLICACDKQSAQKLNIRTDIPLTAAQKTMVSGNNDFAFDLYNNLSDGKSLFISPLSAAYELSILANGVDGDTRNEILTALGLENKDMSGFNEYAQMMRTRLLKMDKTSELRISNMIVSNSISGSLNGDYKNLCSKYYACDVAEMDFSGGRSVVDYVNNFCSRSTSGKVPTILESVNSNDVMYALNAVYFKGQWANPFITGDTRKSSFTNSDGRQTNVDMMHVTEFFEYAELSGTRAIVLPYGNGAFRMTVIVSDHTPLLADWKEINSSVRRIYVDYRMPKFETGQVLQIENALKSMGVKTLFSDTADFSPMTDAEEMEVSGIRQVSWFRLDEKGSEAASVSVNAGPTAPGIEAIFTVDRPFTYVISEVSTGAILFMGYYSGL